MYLKTLEIKNLKLIKRLHLDFTRDGQWRQWTVLVGQNGRGKTAVLQAIALAAAGDRHANHLGESMLQSFRPRPSQTPVTPGDGADEASDTPTFISAIFGLAPTPDRGANRRKRPPTPRVRVCPGAQPSTTLVSTITLNHDVDRFEARSWYESADSKPSEDNPLDTVRDKGLPYWFVAGYGVSRRLRHITTSTDQPPSATQLHRERLSTLFDPDAHLLGVGFVARFDKIRARLFARFVQALMTTTEGLLPELTSVELSGQSGVTKPSDLLERDRIVQTLPGGSTYKLPATWLSHGYQSSLSWLSDLLGHLLIEDPAFDDYRHNEKARPEELQGLVLIDELDLHIHPSWQRTFITALGQTFPKLQFVVTTHSPMLVSALRPDEVVFLEIGEDDRICARQSTVDPRLLTGSELYEELFKTQGIPAQALGVLLDDYRFWARNPYRDRKRDREVARWREQLEAAGVEVPFEPVARKRRRQ